MPQFGHMLVYQFLAKKVQAYFGIIYSKMIALMYTPSMLPVLSFWVKNGLETNGLDTILNGIEGIVILKQRHFLTPSETFRNFSSSYSN